MSIDQNGICNLRDYLKKSFTEYFGDSFYINFSLLPTDYEFNFTIAYSKNYNSLDNYHVIAQHAVEDFLDTLKESKYIKTIITDNENKLKELQIKVDELTRYKIYYEMHKELISSNKE